MKSTIVNAVIEGLNVNKENVKLLIQSLPENQREAGLEILLGAHAYQNIDMIKSTKIVENTVSKEYIKPLELISVSLLENEVKYREDFFNIPVRYYKSVTDFDTDDYKTYSSDKYNIERAMTENKRADFNERKMSITEWMTK